MSAKYIQLADMLRHDLTAAASKNGKLPTEAELSARYHMSRQTVRHALHLLEEEGLILRRQGSGSYLRDPLRRSDSTRLAVITTFLDDYIFPRILHDVQRVFADSGFSTLVYATQNSVNREREILFGLLAQGISGILVEGSKTALPSPNADLYEKFRASGVPVVFLHATYSNLQGFPCVMDDNYSGGYLLARYLMDRGHSRIAGIFKSDDLQGPQRYFGMVDAMREHGLPIPDDEICWYTTADRSLFMSEQSQQTFFSLCSGILNRSTAVICYNDEIAHLLIQSLHREGKNVPQDIAVVSFDDSYFSRIGPVSITSLCHRGQHMGELAARMLLHQLAGGTPQSILVPWELIQRASS